MKQWVTLTNVFSRSIRLTLNIEGIGIPLFGFLRHSLPRLRPGLGLGGCLKVDNPGWELRGRRHVDLMVMCDSEAKSNVNVNSNGNVEQMSCSKFRVSN
jgi:hypothetical protein